MYKNYNLGVFRYINFYSWDYHYLTISEFRIKFKKIGRQLYIAAIGTIG